MNQPQSSSARPYLGLLGVCIRKAREANKQSQRALSRQIHRSEAYVSKLEQGVIDPSFTAFATTALSLRLTPFEVWSLVRMVGLAALQNGETVTPDAYSRPLLEAHP
jgi:transcriptional regulator with XRE-family HTH domain